MNYKDFISDVKIVLESRLDHIVPKHEARIERLAKISKMLKPGQAGDWRAQYESQGPTRKPFIEIPDGL